MAMEPSEVCPTEDAVLALLEYLADPRLPAKSLRDNPSEPQQQAVAKQVHAAVLLYNYYHRKQYPVLEFLGFDSFCKLAVILKPALLGHLKVTQISNYKELDDLANQLSLTEKSIMQACDISRTLDASREVPLVERWPITKVAVFLVDLNKEKCWLKFSSNTEGVWSVIEKDVQDSDRSLGSTIETNQTDKRIRVIQKSSRVESSNDLTDFQQLAYLAVKEATGITQTDLMTLEDHVVYSLSKEKAAAQFYIMQCTKLVKEDTFQLPIKDLIDREICLNSLQDSMLGESPERRKIPRESAGHKIQDSSHLNSSIGAACSHKTATTDLKNPKEKDIIGFSNAFSWHQPSQNEEKCSGISNTTEGDNHQKLIISSLTESYLSDLASGDDIKVDFFDHLFNSLLTDVNFFLILLYDLFVCRHITALKGLNIFALK
ncbi:hypothetical protein TorRG33x02_344980 [Trema orientale]|uniref:Uncharacterized protein n=1 Tax=Trema orientale TaxID=63057 RepID=A0A2P5APJ1_TREOI|nr:hypothetical protein TorRG33x02_344980 [Trema orientale]